ncbi:hypothetical protein AB8Z38_15640 [Bradyrhizobium sp. LLZ17]|uniref:Uncharacterized protein n=1 Tax=Bradyrhizobium sp. LLZ17 TaxID=3239388 RepID=A0AB39XS75_9BRAD
MWISVNPALDAKFERFTTSSLPFFAFLAESADATCGGTPEFTDAAKQEVKIGAVFV